MNLSMIMNKPIMLFLGGAVLGSVITAVVLTGRNHPANFSGQQTTDEQLQKFAEITSNLNITAGVLKNSAETLASLTLPITLIKDKQSSTQSSQSATGDAKQVSNNDAPPESTAKSVQPTRKQIDRFNKIKGKLSDAANNLSLPLGVLMQEANDLTPEQRQELTNEALDMIKRGQLRAEQFVELPGS